MYFPGHWSKSKIPFNFCTRKIDAAITWLGNCLTQKPEKMDTVVSVICSWFSVLHFISVICLLTILNIRIKKEKSISRCDYYWHTVDWLGCSSFCWRRKIISGTVWLDWFLFDIKKTFISKYKKKKEALKRIPYVKRETMNWPTYNWKIFRCSHHQTFTIHGSIYQFSNPNDRP